MLGEVHFVPDPRAQAPAPAPVAYSFSSGAVAREARDFVRPISGTLPSAPSSVSTSHDNDLPCEAYGMSSSGTHFLNAPMDVPGPFGGATGVLSVVSSAEGQGLLLNAFSVINDVAVARAGTQGNPTIITFMGSKAEGSNRMQRRGFATEYAYFGNMHSGTELEESND